MDTYVLRVNLSFLHPPDNVGKPLAKLLRDLANRYEDGAELEVRHSFAGQTISDATVEYASDDPLVIGEDK